MRPQIKQTKCTIAKAKAHIFTLDGAMVDVSLSLVIMLSKIYAIPSSKWSAQTCLILEYSPKILNYNMVN